MVGLSWTFGAMGRATYGPRHPYASQSGADLVGKGQVRREPSEKVTSSNNYLKCARKLSKITPRYVNITHEALVPFFRKYTISGF